MVLEFSLLLAAASLCAFVGVGHTSEVNVGGELGTWTIGLEYTPVQLTLGDTLVCSTPWLLMQGRFSLKRACLDPEDLDRVSNPIVKLSPSALLLKVLDQIEQSDQSVTGR